MQIVRVVAAVGMSVSLGAASPAFGGSVEAQEILLWSGSTVRGEVLRYESGLFLVQVGDGDTQMIQAADVASIDGKSIDAFGAPLPDAPVEETEAVEVPVAAPEVVLPASTEESFGSDFEAAFEPLLAAEPLAPAIPRTRVVVNALVAIKSLGAEWGPIGSEGVLGLETTILPPHRIGTIGLAADFISGGANNVENSHKPPPTIYTVDTEELNVGVRFLREMDMRHPIQFSAGAGPQFVYGGLELVDGQTEERIAADGDNGWGVWAATAVHARLNRHVNIGASLRYSTARLRVFGNDVDPGGVTFGFTAGLSFGFPKSGRPTAGW